MATATPSTSPTPSDAVIRRFTVPIRGDLIRPDESSSTALRQVYNAMIDKRLALIARCGKVLLGILSRGFGVDTRPSFRDSRRDW